MVETDIDVRIADVPLNFRRPDITVYRCIPDEARLYSPDVVLVVEIVSPESSLKTDTVDKKAVYADAGIPIYLIVFLNAAQDAVEKIEEYWLEPTSAYRLVQLHTRLVDHEHPGPGRCEFRPADLDLSLPQRYGPGDPAATQRRLAGPIRDRGAHVSTACPPPRNTVRSE